MSWFQKNYDKAILGVAFLSIAGVGAASFMGGTKPSIDTSGIKPNEAYPWAGLKEKITTSAKEVEAQKVGAKVWDTKKLNPTQTARLFQGPQLIQKAGGDEIFNALAADSKPIRGDVPNSWFIENDLDLTRSKILTRDDDGDKYTNAEEFIGRSNPRDPNSIPSAVLKLKLAEVLELKYELKFKAVAPDLQIKRTKESEPGKETSKSDLSAKVGAPLFDDGRFKIESVADITDNGKPSKEAKISDSVNPEGSPFAVKDGETVNRPTLLAKITCTLDGNEDIIAKEGEALSYKAFPSIKFKLVKINKESQTVEVEYAEGGKATQKQQIKK